MSVWICGFNDFGQIRAHYSTVDSPPVDCPILVEFNQNIADLQTSQSTTSVNREQSSRGSVLSTSGNRNARLKPRSVVDVAIGWSKIYVLMGDGDLVMSSSDFVSDVQDFNTERNAHYTTIGCGWSTVCAASRGSADCLMWSMKDSSDETINKPDFKIDFGASIAKIFTNDSDVFAISDDRHLLSVSLERKSSAMSPLIIQPILTDFCIRTVSCGKHHILVLTIIGVVYSHGNGAQGQLGIGSVEPTLSPTVVEALEGVTVTAIAAGGWHSLAVTDAGDVYAWGWNERGQLGMLSDNVSGKKRWQGKSSPDTRVTDDQLDGRSRPLSTDVQATLNETDEPLPIFVNVLTYPQVIDLAEVYDDVSVKTVAAGSRHSVCLLEDGTVLTWGWNDYGQLGLGDTRSRDSPCVVELFRNYNKCVTNVFAGWWNTVFITE